MKYLAETNFCQVGINNGSKGTLIPIVGKIIPNSGRSFPFRYYSEKGRNNGSYCGGGRKRIDMDRFIWKQLGWVDHLTALQSIQHKDWLHFESVPGSSKPFFSLLNGKIQNLFTRIYPELHSFRPGSASESRLNLDIFLKKNFEFVERYMNLLALCTKAFEETPGGLGVLNGGHWSPLGIFSRAYPELRSRLVYLGESKEVFLKRCLMDHLVCTEFVFVDTKEDLKWVSSKEVLECPRGSSLVSKENRSVGSVLEEVYTELKELVGRETWGVPNHFKSNQLVTKIIKYYEMKAYEDWYLISLHQLNKIYGKRISKSTIFRLLEEVLPEKEWERDKLALKNYKKTRQRYLGRKLRELFQGYTIYEEYRCTFFGKLVVFDFFIPEAQLVVEYQGEQHYYSAFQWMSWEEQRGRDSRKKQFCELRGWRLAWVPYWWDDSLEALQNFIKY